MQAETQPDSILTALGGHGVAATYLGKECGPSVLLRCELDGLPIEEVNPDLSHRSEVAGKGHLCGHAGHMTILAATVRWQGCNRPNRGRVILLFQPAEEDGSGAEKVLEDPRFPEIAPDFAFALHNFPGVPLGHAVIAPGPMNCASRGMKIKLEGHTAHASQPEMGRSPAATLSTLIRDLVALASGDDAADPDFALVTVTHARLGEPAFGISPGEGELWVTLRTKQDAHMDGLVARAENLVADHAAHAKLDHSISYHDVFQHCENDYEAAEILKNALHAENCSLATTELPMRGSEDFGRFRGCSKSAMFLLGSGLNHPSLHNPDFDSPDELILPGARIFTRTPKMLCYD